MYNNTLASVYIYDMCIYGVCSINVFGVNDPTVVIRINIVLRERKIYVFMYKYIYIYIMHIICIPIYNNCDQHTSVTHV